MRSLIDSRQEMKVPVTRSPMVARRRLGAALRDLRNETRHTIEEAAAVLDCSSAKVSRLETGKGVPRPRDIRDLLDFYGAADESREELMVLVDESLSEDTGLVTDFRDVLEDNTDAAKLYSLEQDAAAISLFESDVVPGLLQTPAYATAMIRLIFPEQTERQQARKVEFRLRRQEALRRGLRLSVVLSETAVRRPIGGPDVMREQLDALAKNLRNGLSTVDFHLVPLSVILPAVLGGPFAVITFDDAADQDVVYLEGRTGAVYLESDSEVRIYQQTFSELVKACPNRDESLKLLEDIHASLT